MGKEKPAKSHTSRRLIQWTIALPLFLPFFSFSFQTYPLFSCSKKTSQHEKPTRTSAQPGGRTPRGEQPAQTQAQTGVRHAGNGHVEPAAARRERLAKVH